MPDKPRKPFPEPMSARVARLEDSITYFYNLINELRQRVSTVEEELERLRR